MIILGLGCNIGLRLTNLREALKHLHSISELKVICVSPVYESDAMLPEDAPKTWDMPFLNLAVSCKTSLTPQELLHKIKNIEEKMGRATHLHWAPRIIDIDILAWGEENYLTEKICIPHKGLTERPFALWPLSDLMPNWKYCAKNTEETGKKAEEIVKKWGSRFDGKDAPFHTHQIQHRVDTPEIMGILNITPDSFSDGGKYQNLEEAIRKAKKLFAEGADIIDIGAESTRPQRSYLPLTPKQEWQRLEPVLEGLLSTWKNTTSKPKLSIDTRNSETAKKALEFGIDFLNDVSGFSDINMCKIAAENKHVKAIAMHNLGIPPHKEKILDGKKDASEEIYFWAEKKIENMLSSGIKRENIIIDVGIGFGKSAEQSFSIIKNISQFKKLNLPILVGHSRKSFLNKFTTKPFAERDLETAFISCFLAKEKVDYLRVHNVDATMRLLKIDAAF